MSRLLWSAGHAGGLLAVTGALAVVSGEPFVFPSLGPSAYLLAVGSESSPRRIVGGHTVGVVAGWLAYALLGAGLVVTGEFAPLTLAGVRLAASGTVAVTLTVAGMLATDTRHAPACATTLIVSLGLLVTPGEMLVILLSVSVLFVTHVVGRRVVSRLTAASVS